MEEGTDWQRLVTKMANIPFLQKSVLLDESLEEKRRPLAMELIRVNGSEGHWYTQ